MGERCPTCDRPRMGLDEMLGAGAAGDRARFQTHCWSDAECTPVDWRARALAAEAKLHEKIRLYYSQRLYVAEAVAQERAELAELADLWAESARLKVAADPYGYDAARLDGEAYALAEFAATIRAGGPKPEKET